MGDREEKGYYGQGKAAEWDTGKGAESEKLSSVKYMAIKKVNCSGTKERGFREDEKGSYMLWERWNRIEKKKTEAEAWEERRRVQVCTMPKSVGMGMEADTHKYRKKNNECKEEKKRPVCQRRSGKEKKQMKDAMWEKKKGLHNP